MFKWLKNLFGGSNDSKPPRDVSLTTLKPGDVVIHFDVTYVVEQRITYHQQGFFWFDYRLDDGGGQKAWLSVADDDELELAFFHPVDDLELPFPPPKEFVYQGTQFEFEEGGRIDAKIDRGTGSETRTVVEAYDYESEDGRLLGIQRWNEAEVEMAIGNSVRPVELDLLPGGDES
jgi:hypothetical protein